MDRFTRSPDPQTPRLPDVPLQCSKGLCEVYRTDDLSDCIRLSDPPINRPRDLDGPTRLGDYPIYRPADNPTVQRPADAPTPQRTP